MQPDLNERPTLALWVENFALIPIPFDLMEVWHGIAENVRGVSLRNVATCCTRNSPIASIANCWRSSKDKTGD